MKKYRTHADTDDDCLIKFRGSTYSFLEVTTNRPDLFFGECELVLTYSESKLSALWEAMGNSSRAFMNGSDYFYEGGNQNAGYELITTGFEVLYE